jgi:hypothetical protein
MRVNAAYKTSVAYSDIQFVSVDRVSRDQSNVALSIGLKRIKFVPFFGLFSLPIVLPIPTRVMPLVLPHKDAQLCLRQIELRTGKPTKWESLAFDQDS